MIDYGYRPRVKYGGLGKAFVYCFRCGTKNPEADKFCRQCGQELAAGMGRAPAIPFATRCFAFREGGTLVVSANAPLPARCVRCRVPSSRALDKTFYWHTPWLGLMGIIVALVVSRKMEVIVPLCERHWSRRRLLLWTGRLALIASFAAIFALGDMVGSWGWAFLAWLLLFFGGLVLIDHLDVKVLRPSYIDDEVARFDGACEEFLSYLASGTSGATP